MIQPVLPFFEQETAALRATLQEQQQLAAQKEAYMLEDIKQLRRAIVALGRADIDANDPELIRARQIYGAIVLVDGIGGENE